MATIEEQIKSIEDEIFNTQKNKATEHHIGKLKAKLAKMRAQLELHRAKSSGGGKGYYIKKSGDATVALVGFPSVGKSSLLNVMTGSKSEVGEYHFTTLEVIPGIMDYEGAKIQILDMPGIIRGASKGKGRGKEVIAAARNSDIILLMGDVFNFRIDVLERELYDAGIRLNQIAPDIHFSHSEKGGLIVRSTIKITKMTEKEIIEIVRAYGLISGTIVFREDVEPDRLVDFLAGNRVYIPTITVINKIDLAYDGFRKNVRKYCKTDFMNLSATKDVGVEKLKKILFDSLQFMRIYLKPQRGPADMDEPLVILKDSTVKAICEHLHRDFVDLFRYAHVWGPSGKYPGQSIGMSHVLEDGDVVSIVLRRK